MRERKRRTPRPGKWIDTKKAFVVHPDILEGLMHYNKDSDNLKDVFEGRKKMTEEGEEYWNTSHDEEFKEYAKERTQNHLMKGNKWPSRRKNRKKR